MLRKITIILLALLLSGLPTLTAETITDTTCCHSPEPVQKVQSHSCCEMEKPEEQPQSVCDIFEITSSSLDNCGCIHEINSVDETIIINTKLDLSSVVVLESDQITDDEIRPLNSTYESGKIHFQNSIPIYISVSSYLI